MYIQYLLPEVRAPPGPALSYIILATSSRGSSLWPHPPAITIQDDSRGSIPPSAVRCAQISGYESPLQTIERKSERKGRKVNQLALCFPNYPLVHPCGTSAILDHSICCHTGQLKEPEKSPLHNEVFILNASNLAVNS